MPIVKLNKYIPGKDVENLIDNVDVNFLGEDKTEISVNYSVSPAKVTIKEGSIIEVNGDRYRIEDSDETFTMANAGHNYITFNGVIFSSSATIGTYNPLKVGYYLGATRILKYYIDQANETNLILLDILHSEQLNITKDFDYIKVTLDSNQSTNGIIQFDTIIFDYLSNWDAVNYRYTAYKSGYYLVNVHPSISKTIAGATVSFNVNTRKNGTIICKTLFFVSSTSHNGYDDSIIVEYLDKGDYIDFECPVNLSASHVIVSGEYESYCTIQRLL